MRAASFGKQNVLEIMTSPSAPYQIAVADLDEDGDADVFTGSSPYSEIAFFENRLGEPTSGFARQTLGYAITQSLDAADLDGDGDLDVFVADNGVNGIRWLENCPQHGPDFCAYHLVTNLAAGARSAAAADLDGDGDLDLLSAFSTDNKVAWYENRLDGAGRLRRPATSRPRRPRALGGRGRPRRRWRPRRARRVS